MIKVLLAQNRCTEKKKMGKIDTTLFIKLRENDILIVQIYVDDIIFGATNVSLCEEFA